MHILRGDHLDSWALPPLPRRSVPACDLELMCSWIHAHPNANRDHTPPHSMAHWVFAEKQMIDGHRTSNRGCIGERPCLQTKIEHMSFHADSAQQIEQQALMAVRPLQ